LRVIRAADDGTEFNDQLDNVCSVVRIKSAAIIHSIIVLKCILDNQQKTFLNCKNTHYASHILKRTSEIQRVIFLNY